MPTFPGPLPTPRHSHTASSVGTVMYIFGGQFENHYLGDIVAFDLKTSKMADLLHQWPLVIV